MHQATAQLLSQLQRLYFLPQQAWLSLKREESASPDPDASDQPRYQAEGVLAAETIAHCLAGKVLAAFDPIRVTLTDGSATLRAMVIRFDRASDWDKLVTLRQAVRANFDLPAPAVSVAGQGGFQLWFSLAEPVPVEQAQAFLAALRLNYLADIPLSQLGFCPDLRPTAAAETASKAPAVIPLVPAFHTPNARWSAFIDPAFGEMFIDEPGLEMAPNLDKQAEMLAGMDSIKTADFQRVLSQMQATAIAQAAPSFPAAADNNPAKQPQLLGGYHLGSHYANHSDPKSFLLVVMNDPSASAEHRIKAAEALLPYFR
jgi:hypothetical protein